MSVSVCSPALLTKINWALHPFKNGLATKVIKTETQTIGQQRKDAERLEKEWGNNTIGQINNGNWTTLLGEGLVKEVLELLGENPRMPQKRGNYLPDIETDKFIYEVKTSNWTVSGTAGEKVLGTMYKYSDIPKLYGKPLKIVCVAYQEYELTHGNTKIFGELSERKQAFINLARQQDIEYIKFSDLIKTLL